MASFRNRASHVAPTDPVYSRLLDARWAELALSRLRDEAEFLDKRSKLAQRFQPNKREEVEDSNNPEAAPKAKTRPPRRPQTEPA